MSGEQESTAYLREFTDGMQAGHQCAEGHWWHEWVDGKEQENVNELVDRLFAHIVGCRGVAEPLRQHLSMLLDRRTNG